MQSVIWAAGMVAVALVASSTMALTQAQGPSGSANCFGTQGYCVVDAVGLGHGGAAPSPEAHSPAAPAGQELTAIVVEHYEGVLGEYGTHVGVRAARKHLDWYLEASGISIAKETRVRLLNSQQPSEVIGLVEAIFNGDLREAA